MATPKKGYYIGDERVPGVTTVLGRFKDSGPLMYWAFNQGKAGMESLYEKRDEAAAIGTLAHEMIEDHINGETIEDPGKAGLVIDEGRVKAYSAFQQYLSWEKQSGLKLLSKYQEIQLVCPKYKFGGTPDALVEINGEVGLGDWKTSKGIYRDYLIQVAAYEHLVNHGVRKDTGEPLGIKITGGLHIMRFAKEYPDFEHRYFAEAELAWEQFKLFLKAYQIDKQLKDRVK